MKFNIENYTEEQQKIISNTILTKEQLETVDRCIDKFGKNSPYFDVFEDMYKLYLANVSLTDIAGICNRTPRTIQILFKKLGLARDLKTAQKIAVKKRDYVKIRETYKRTMLDRITINKLCGSAIEQYARQKLALTLNEEIKKLGGEAIVGVNTITPVGELDIPIIILLNNKTYKYGIEVDGTGFHNNTVKGWNNANDKDKEEKLNDIGYKILRISTKAYILNDSSKIKYENELKRKINEIVEEILGDFK